LALWPEAFLRAVVASGTPRLAHELAAIAELRRAYGDGALVAALERALAFRCYGAAEARSILVAGSGTASVHRAGERLAMELPTVPVRPLAAYALDPAR
jgi:hypothetical protein